MKNFSKGNWWTCWDSRVIW